MPDESHIHSRPYSTAAACEKCVFGRGEHADWCRNVEESILFVDTCSSFDRAALDKEMNKEATKAVVELFLPEKSSLSDCTFAKLKDSCVVCPGVIKVPMREWGEHIEGGMHPWSPGVHVSLTWRP